MNDIIQNSIYLVTKYLIIMLYTQINTPIGNMVAVASDNGICFLQFEDQNNLNKQTQKLNKNKHLSDSKNNQTHIDLLRKELGLYFKKKLTSFTVSIDIFGTEFQKSVYEALIKIPYGETISYKEQAIKIDRPNSIRAVANANASNMIAILVPCHRVIGSNNTLTGYAGGLNRKKYLIDLESKIPRLFD